MHPVYVLNFSCLDQRGIAQINWQLHDALKKSRVMLMLSRIGH